MLRLSKGSLRNLQMRPLVLGALVVHQTLQMSALNSSTLRRSVIGSWRTALGELQHAWISALVF